MARLLESPKSLAIRWEPPPPGFPRSFFARAGGLPSLLADLGRSGDWRSLAAKYKYDIIQCLNPSLEVNGRAPVAVYLPAALTPQASPPL
jgi:hypothetical protein